MKNDWQNITQHKIQSLFVLQTLMHPLKHLLKIIITWHKPWPAVLRLLSASEMKVWRHYGKLYHKSLSSREKMHRRSRRRTQWTSFKRIQLYIRCTLMHFANVLLHYIRINEWPSKTSRRAKLQLKAAGMIWWCICPPVHSQRTIHFISICGLKS